MNFGVQDKKTFSEMLMPFKTAFGRYWMISWAPAAAIAVLGLAVSLRIPDYFISDVGISIQAQNVDIESMGSREMEIQEEQFESLIQEMLSRPRLRSILDKFDLYPDLRGVKGKEKAIVTLRRAINIQPIISPSGRALSQTFRMSYVHSDATLAYKVADALAKLFLNEGTLNQIARTRRTEEFYEAKLREQAQRLEKIERKREEFLKAYASQLPEYREEALARLTSAQNQLLNNGQILQANNTRRDYIEKELAIVNQNSAETAIQDASSITDNPTASVLQLERALAILRARYSEKHPDIVATKKRIEILKRQLASSGAPKEISVSKTKILSNPEARRLRRELNEINVKSAALTAENEALKKLIGDLNTNIEAMPLRDQELSKIVRDYESVKEAYQDLARKREDAAMRTSIIRSQNGMKFELFDPPSVPFLPAGPNRLILGGLGIVAGLLLLLGLPVALYFLDGSYKSRDDVEYELAIPVVGIIPTLETAGVISKRRRYATTSFLASACSLVAGVAVIILVI